MPQLKKLGLRFVSSKLVTKSTKNVLVDLQSNLWKFKVPEENWGELPRHSLRNFALNLGTARLTWGRRIKPLHVFWATPWTPQMGGVQGNGPLNCANELLGNELFLELSGESHKQVLLRVLALWEPPLPTACRSYCPSLLPLWAEIYAEVRRIALQKFSRKSHIRLDSNCP